VIVVDSSLIYALLDQRDTNHHQASEWYDRQEPAMATTPLILAEVDHLAGARAGRTAQEAWRRDVGGGVYDVTWWSGAERTAVAIAKRYADLGIGLADASLVALAARLDTADIATFDERHFRAIQPENAAAAFRLLPIDA
jgi:predicted nucleic acid-binding protein